MAAILPPIIAKWLSDCSTMVGTPTYQKNLPLVAHSRGLCIKHTVHGHSSVKNVAATKATASIQSRVDESLQRELRFDSVVFDMDGTMTVSNIDFEDMRVRTGITIGDLFTVMESWDDENKVKQAYDVILELESEACKTLSIQPGLMEVLIYLRSKGANLGLVTRNTTLSVDAFFAKVGEEWRDSFSVILTREFRFVKPDKRLLMHVAQVWGVPPSQMLMVGDSREDIECGNAAGTATCLVHGGGNEVSTGPAPSGAEADFRVTSLLQLLHILQGSESGEALSASERASPGAVPGLSFTDTLFAENVLRGSFCSYPRLAGTFGGISASTSPGDVVAHIGCGDGNLTKLLASQGLRVQGFEADKQTRALATKRGLTVGALSLVEGPLPVLRRGALGPEGQFNCVLSITQQSLTDSNDEVRIPWGSDADVDEIWRAMKLGGNFSMEHMFEKALFLRPVDVLLLAIEALRGYKMAFQERGFLIRSCSTEERGSGIHIRFVALKPAGIHGIRAVDKK